MRILLFGRLRDGAPVGPVPDAVRDLDSLRAWLATARPELVGPSVKIAVNDQLVVGNRALGADDELSFLPPMSGG